MLHHLAQSWRVKLRHINFIVHIPSSIIRSDIVWVANQGGMWRVVGREWRCRRRLFAWEEESLLECIGMLVNVFLQVNTDDRWNWRLDQTGHYSFKGEYKYFVHDSLSSEPGFQDAKDIMRNKLAPLKVLDSWSLHGNC
ncbi:hypothetical protein L195_g016060 [Trifolium pratense]|uniref:Uncharacterized protein n=1 Tax=Trifolium pratense TaxID=57577 RepID=A0A2K3MQA6_TRIPR|nr:hypothetical protein L195_g016060 [Trifolium pratense]